MQINYVKLNYFK